MPDADFGTSSTNSMRRSFLYGATQLGDVCQELVALDVPLDDDAAYRCLTPLLGQHPDDARRRFTFGCETSTRLELGRRHLVALVLDQLLEPVDDVEEPVLIDPPDVTGPDPAVADEGLARSPRRC